MTNALAYTSPQAVLCKGMPLTASRSDFHVLCTQCQRLLTHIAQAMQVRQYGQVSGMHCMTMLIQTHSGINIQSCWIDAS